MQQVGTDDTATRISNVVTRYPAVETLRRGVSTRGPIDGIGNLGCGAGLPVMALTAAFAVWFAPKPAQAIIATWDGGGATNNWSEGANWTGDIAPAVSDTARFDATSVKQALVDVSFSSSIKCLEILSGFADSVKLDRQLNITDSLLLTGGTFRCGGFSLLVGGSFSQTGGVFSSSSDSIGISKNMTVIGGTFIPNSGRIVLGMGSGTVDIGGLALNDVLINKSAFSLSVTGTMTVNGTLTLQAISTFTNGTLAARGEVVTRTASSIGGAGVLLIDGTGAQSISAPNNNSGHLPQLTINKSAGTLNLSDTLKINRNFVHIAGAVNAGTGTVEFTGNADDTINAAGMSFNHVKFNLGPTYRSWIIGTLDVNGNLALSGSGTPWIENGTITVAGNLSSNVNPLSGNAAITLDGTAEQTINTSGFGQIPSGLFTVNKSSGRALLVSPFTIPGALSIISGVLNQGNSSFSLTVLGNITVSSGAGWVNQGWGGDTLGGSVTNNGTITLNGYGGSCGDADGINIRSSSAAVQRAWAGGGIFNITDCNIQDMGGSFTVYSCTNNGNNTMTFNGLCPPVVWDGGGPTNNWSDPQNWSGDYVPSGADSVVFNAASAKSCSLDVVDTVNHLSIAPSYTGVFDFGRKSLSVSMNADLAGGASFVTAEGALAFIGAAQQLFTPKAGAIMPHIKHPGIGALKLQGANLMAQGFNQTAGTLDLNGFDIDSIVNDFTIANGSGSSFANHAGRSVHVRGNANLVGQMFDYINLNPTPGMKWYVHGNLFARYDSIKNCTTMVSPGNAANSVDEGFNQGWNFGGVVTWNVGVGNGGDWGDTLSWTPNKVPTLADSVAFGPGMTGACSLNVDGLARILYFAAGYNGTFFLKGHKLTVRELADFRSGGAFSLSGGGAVEFIGPDTTRFLPQFGMVIPKIIQSGPGVTLTDINAFKTDTLVVQNGEFMLGNTPPDTVMKMVDLQNGRLNLGNRALYIGASTVNFSTPCQIKAESARIGFLGTAAQTFTPKPGMFIKALEFKNTSGGVTVATHGFRTDSLLLMDGTLNLGAGLMDSVGSGLVIAGGSPALNFGSSILKISASTVNLNSLFGLTAGTGVLEFTSPNSQVFTPYTSVMHPVIKTSGAGTVTLQTNKLITSRIIIGSDSLVTNAAFKADTVVIGASGVLDLGSANHYDTVKTVTGTGALHLKYASLNVQGNLNLSGLSAVAGFMDTLRFVGSTPQSFTPKAGLSLRTLEQTGNGGTTVQTFGFKANSLRIMNGTFNLGAGLNDSAGAVSGSGGGTLDFGSSVLTMGNTSVDLGSIGTVVPGTGALRLISTAAAYYYPRAGTDPNIIFNSPTMTINVSSAPLRCPKVSVLTGSLAIDTSCKVDTINVATGASLYLSTSASIQDTVKGLIGTGSVYPQSATLCVDGSLNMAPFSTFLAVNTKIKFIGSSSRNFTPRPDGVINTLIMDGTGTVTTSTNGFRVNTLNLMGGTLSLGAGLIDSVTADLNCGASGAIDFGSSTLRFGADTADFSPLSALMAGTGNLEFYGASPQVLIPKYGPALPALRASGPGGLTLAKHPLKAPLLAISTGTVLADTVFNIDSVYIGASGNFNLGGVNGQIRYDSVKTITGSGVLNLSYMRVAVTGGLNLTTFSSVTGLSNSGFGFAAPTAVNFTPRPGMSLEFLGQAGPGSLSILTNGFKAYDFALTGGTLDLGGGLIDTVSGPLVFSGSSTLDFNGSTLVIGTPQVDLSGLSTLIPGTGTLEFFSGSAQGFVPKAGAPHPNIRVSNAFGVTCSTSALTGKNLTLQGGEFGFAGIGLTHSVDTLSGNGDLTFSGAKLAVTGNLDLSAVANMNGVDAADTIDFVKTAGTQILTPKIGDSLPVVAHTGAATLQLATNALSAYGFLQDGGPLDLNGQNITTISSGDFVVKNGTPSTMVNLDNRTITVAGKTDLSGTSGNLLNLDVATGWTLAASATPPVKASYATIGRSSITGGSWGRPLNSVNAGNNDYWDFFSPKPGITDPLDSTLDNSLAAFAGSAVDSGSGTIKTVDVALYRGSDSYYWNGTSWQASPVWLATTGGASWTYGSLPAWTDDNYIFLARATDSADNTGNPDSSRVTYDATAPTATSLSVLDNQGYTADAQPDLSISATGADSMAFKLDAGAWSAYEVYAASKTNFDISSGGNGLRKVYVKYRDLAGNETDGTLYDSTTYDTQAPTTGSIVITDISDYTNDATPTLSLSATGADSMRFKVDAGAWGSWLTYATSKSDLDISAGGDGLKMVWVEYKDLAGNASSSLYDSTNYDITAPTVGTITIADNAGFTTDIDPAFTFAGVGGADSVRYGINDSATLGAWEAYSSLDSVSLGTEGGKRIWAQFKDIMGNLSVKISDSTSYDATVPTVAITGAPAYKTNTAPFNVTATFSESVTGFVVGDVTVGNGSASSFSGSGTTYTFDVTPSGGGNITIDIADSVAQDAASNYSTAASQVSVTYDATVPTVAITGAPSYKTNTTPFNVTATFSESVTGFVVGDITMGNGSASNLSGSGTTYTFDVTPSGVGNITIDIADSVAQDAASNYNTAASQVSVTYDATAPTVSLSSVAANPTNATSFAVSISFSEPVNNFSIADILVGNGTASGFNTSDSITYTVGIAPAATGLVTVDVNAGAAQDSFGNNSIAATQLSRFYDNTPAVSAITAPASGSTVSALSSITGTASDVGSGVRDVAIIIQRLSDLRYWSGSGFDSLSMQYSYAAGTTAWSLNTAGVTWSNGGYRIVSAAKDSTYNVQAVFDTVLFSFDNTVPTVSITGAPSYKNNTAPFNVAATFSESVTGFVIGDVTVGNGSASNFSGSGTTYTFDITPSGAGNITIDIASNVAQDVAGNNNTAASQVSVTYDATAPTVSITGAPSAINNTTPFSVTATFSESVTGFVAGDVTVGNGSASGFSGSGTTYTFDITPSGAGNVTIDIASGAAQDVAGNNNTAASQVSAIYDAAAPTVAIAGAPSYKTNTTPFAVTATFSESVTGFVAGDVTVGNGSASNFSGSGATYTFDLTPSGAGNITIDIASNVAQDVAGNNNTAAPQVSVTYDATPPTVSITGAPSYATNITPFNVTATFSESVIGFALGDVTVGYGSASNFSGSGTTYTFDVAPSGAGDITIDIASGIAQDAAGNNNTAAPQVSVTYDATPPTVVTASSAADPTNTSPFNLTVTFNEDVTGFDLTDIITTNATASGLTNTVANRVWTAAIMPLADGPVTVNVPANSAQDLAGNFSTAATQLSRTYDGQPPFVTLSTAVSDPTNASPFGVTIAFSEAVTGFTLGDITTGNGTAGNFVAVNASTYTADITPLLDGPVTANVAAGTALDAAGNNSTVAPQLSRTFDGTPPTGGLSIAADTTLDPDPAILFTAVGAVSMQLAMVGDTGTALWKPFQANDSLNITLGGFGLKRILVRYKDGVGNLTAWIEDTVWYLNPTPVVTSIALDTAVEDQAFSYIATATDDQGPPTLAFLGLPSWLTASGATVNGTPGNGTGDTTFKVRAWDGNSADTQVVTLRVLPVNDPPAVTSAPSASATEDVLFSYTGTATDPDNTPLVSFVNVPVWLTASNGTLSGTPVNGTGSTTFRVAAWDGALGDTADVVLTVTPVNDPPVIVSALSDTATEDLPFLYAARATDVDGTPSFSFTGLPAWLIASGDTLKGVPTEGAADASIMMTASDGALSDSRMLVVKVLSVNDAPVIGAFPTLDTALEDAAYSRTLTAADPDAGDSLSWQLLTGPGGLTLNPATGALSWTPTNTDIGNHAIRARVRDRSGAADTLLFTLTVVNTNDPPVFLSSLPADTAVEDSAYTLTVLAEDMDAGDALRFSLRSAPMGMVVDSISGLVTFLPAGNQTGDNAVSIEVKDLAGATDLLTFNLFVENRNDAPVITTTLDADTAFQDAVYAGALSATDVDAGDALTWSLVSAPAGLSIDGVSGALSWTPANADVKTHSVTVKVTDPAGASGTHSFSLIVLNANDAPRIALAGTPAILYGALKMKWFLDDDDRLLGLDSLLSCRIGLIGRATAETLFTVVKADQAISASSEFYPLFDGDYRVFIQANDGKAATLLETEVRIGDVATGSALSSEVAAGDWRMVSLPLNGDQDIQILAATGATVYRWNSPTGSYRDPESGLLYVKRGAGYWVYSDTALTLGVAGGLRVTDSKACTLPTDSGWNMIASPYPYAVSVDPALHAGLFAWNGTGYEAVSVLEPWKAYFCWTDGSTLPLDGRAWNPDSAQKLAGKPALFKSADDWLIRVSVKGSRSSDADNFLGLGKGAADLREPPTSPAGGVRAYFVRGEAGRETQLSRSLAQPGSVTTEWLFCVDPAGEPGGITLAFDGAASLPSGTRVFLADGTSLTEVAGENGVRVAPSGKHYYRIIVTSDPEFALKQVTAFSLDRNAPNPFNPATRIGFALPTAFGRDGRPVSGLEKVTLRVYDLRGVMVRTVVDGLFETGKRYSTTWNSRDRNGVQVASGVYIYRIQAGTRYTMQRMMTLIK